MLAGCGRVFVEPPPAGVGLQQGAHFEKGVCERSAAVAAAVVRVPLSIGPAAASVRAAQHPASCIDTNMWRQELNRRSRFVEGMACEAVQDSHTV